MMRGLLQLSVLIGLLGVASGCGGSDSGPRGATSSGAAGSGSVSPMTRPTMRTVAYLPTYHGALSNWSRQLAFHNVTYVNLSFAEVDEAGNIRFPDSGFSSFVASAQANGVKVCVALGGATTIDTGGVFATLLQDDKRPAFVDKLVAFAADNQLDCLDIDLEGNGVNEYYEAFVTELAARLKPDGRELTAAVANWFGDKITDRALASFDFVNVMAYDLYASNRVPDQYSSIDAATTEVERWAARMPKEKVVYGVPFYGMRWPHGGGKAPDIIGYSDLLRSDAAAATQDLLQNADTITYLNSRATIQAKAVIAKSYGGIMAWEVGQDASGEASLLEAVRDAVP
jgi:spore germination protein YaaH